MVYRSCPETIAFVDLWRAELEGKEMRNQRAFNSLLEKKAKKLKMDIIVKTLPEKLFPNGDLYFKKMADSERSKTVVIHNNGISGYENKVDRMKAYGLWVFWDDIPLLYNDAKFIKTQDASDSDSSMFMW